MTQRLGQYLDRVREQLGKDVVVTDPDLILPWLTDWRGRWTGRSPALLEPRETRHVSVMLALASELGQPIVTQGGNSSMVGGATPDDSGDQLILSTRRMNAIRAIDAKRRVAVAEAGTILETLHEEARAHDLRFPLTLGAKGSATIGGLASTNAGGTQVLRFGTMRGLVEGVEAVLPDGSVHDGLSGLKKDNRGFSLDQLLIGAEGTLGVITAARLKLVPLPRGRTTIWAALADLDHALDLLTRLQDGLGDRLEGFEVLPHDSLVAAMEHLGIASPIGTVSPWYALVEIAYPQAGEGREKVEALLAAALEANIIGDAVVAANESQSQALWRIRDSLSDAEKAHYGMATQHDISVPVADIPAFMAKVREAVEARWPGSQVSGYGHLGDGNIHLHVRAMERAREDWRQAEGEEIERFVHDIVIAHGGSISAEHGIGVMKRDELARLGEPARLMALRAVKVALDPAGIMNPGKLIP
ncbi:FAD-binding oxidoreductase [Sphingomicrobium lutaoense]|uniref:FAD/FMN-containing dehydrogenase n=1 Tax=Sphingomicrobium lutaoense TaxID=515949 RepID=A0A839Z3T4_9SPHN|nr:FAD-binding oxidoreductase [Sphingomicrobium lutaoense]MBB3764262.1 FAD/FMN-containing dehydrogenase [Sphingomicrobium lutaoense]